MDRWRRTLSVSGTVILLIAVASSQPDTLASMPFDRESSFMSELIISVSGLRGIVGETSDAGCRLSFCRSLLRQDSRWTDYRRP